MLSFIRGLIANKYSPEVAEEISILYGGSCSPSNAQELFSQPDIDGGLIGGASLKAPDFLAIINAY
jgi:triosephosphate isomerase